MSDLVSTLPSVEVRPSQEDLLAIAAKWERLKQQRKDANKRYRASHPQQNKDACKRHYEKHRATLLENARKKYIQKTSADASTSTDDCQ
jgi:hypothetical protein